jgi:hypothetical protein
LRDAWPRLRQPLEHAHLLSPRLGAQFPFEAFGLSDKYQVAPASVSEFGFTYDEEIMQKLGGDVWAGVKLAEAEFSRRAERANLKPEEMRRLMRARYQEQMNITLRLRTTQPAETEVSRQPGGSTSTNGPAS